MTDRDDRKVYCHRGHAIQQDDVTVIPKKEVHYEQATQAQERFHGVSLPSETESKGLSTKRFDWLVEPWLTVPSS